MVHYVGISDEKGSKTCTAIVITHHFFTPGSHSDLLLQTGKMIFFFGFLFSEFFLLKYSFEVNRYIFFPGKCLPATFKHDVRGLFPYQSQKTL